MVLVVLTVDVDVGFDIDVDVGLDIVLMFLLVTMLLQQFDVFAPISEQEVEEHFNGKKS